MVEGFEQNVLFRSNNMCKVLEGDILPEIKKKMNKKQYNFLGEFPVYFFSMNG